MTKEQLESLEHLREFQEQSKYEEEHIEQLFKQKKLEIMITALFNERFELDSKRLYEDIKTCVREHGDIDGIVSINPESYEREFLNPFSENIDDEIMSGKINLEPRRSYLRLQDAHSYYTKKEDNNK